MKSKILSLLKSTEDYISGEWISEELNISRTAVWKHIKNLKSEGYLIDGVSKKGYKLIESPNTLSAHEIQANLKTKFIGKNISYLDTVDSTNKYAKKLAIEGAEDGTLVISKIQSGGKGRFDRPWTSPEGGIWASIILKPNLEPYDAPKLTLIAAAAITKCLKKYNLDIKIKWPNDLLINDKKICGILTEMNCDLDGIKHIILGFGINANILADNFPSAVATKATSILIETGLNINLSHLIADILYTFEEMYNYFLSNINLNEILPILRNNSYLLGKEISVNSRSGTHNYLCLDISDSGELLVKDSLNNILELSSGEVSLSSNYNV